MKSNQKKYVLVAILALVAIVSLAAAFMQSDPPDPASLNEAQMADYLASKDFGKLDPKQKQAFMQHVRQNAKVKWESLSSEQIQAVKKNTRELFRQKMDERMEAYNNASPEERTAMLDQFIDGMQKKRGDGKDQGKRGRKINPDRMRTRIENSNPKRRAQMTEFKKALRERMEERGIKHP